MIDGPPSGHGIFVGRVRLFRRAKDQGGKRGNQKTQKDEKDDLRGSESVFLFLFRNGIFRGGGAFGVFGVPGVSEAHGAIDITEIVAAKDVAILFSVFGIVAVIGACDGVTGKNIARFIGITGGVISDFDFFIQPGRGRGEIRFYDGRGGHVARKAFCAVGIVEIRYAVVTLGFTENTHEVGFGQIEKEQAGSLLRIGIECDVRIRYIGVSRCFFRVYPHCVFKKQRGERKQKQKREKN